MQTRRRESVLATLMFTDIVRSSDLVAELGDRRWRILLSRHHALIRRELRRYRGREIDTAGDGFFASFDNPGNAIRCAAAVVEAVQELGIDVRIGLHLGQAEIVGKKLGGSAVHVAARVMSLAGPAEVLVTTGLKDVVPAPDFTFADHGSHGLKGVPGEWHLFRVTAVEKRLPGPLEPRLAAERRASVQAPPLWRRRYVPFAAGVAAVVAIAAGAAVILGGDSPRTARAPVDYLARVDPATGQVVKRIPIGNDPIDVTVGDGSVWVLDDDGSVRRIDPVTNSALAIAAVAKDPRAIAAGDSGVWVADGTTGMVHEIDPASNRVTASFRIGGVANDVAVGEGGVWVAAPIEVVRVDPSSGRTESEELDTAFDVEAGVRYRTAVGAGSVWATLSEDPAAFKAPLTGGRFERFDIGVQPRDVAVFGGDVWVVACGTPGTVLRLDGRTAEVSAQISAGGARCGFGALAASNPISIAAGGEGVWVTDALNGTISRISDITNQVDAPIRVGDMPTAVAVGLGSVWVVVDGTESTPSPTR